MFTLKTRGLKYIYNTDGTADIALIVYLHLLSLSACLDTQSLLTYQTKHRTHQRRYIFPLLAF